MTRQKKVFVALSVLFFGLLAYASWDIASRTTFPGAKPQLKERIRENYFQRDSAGQDSLSNRIGDTLPPSP